MQLTRLFDWLVVLGFCWFTFESRIAVVDLTLSLIVQNNVLVTRWNPNLIFDPYSLLIVWNANTWLRLSLYEALLVSSLFCLGFDKVLQAHLVFMLITFVRVDHLNPSCSGLWFKALFPAYSFLVKLFLDKVINVSLSNTCIFRLIAWPFCLLLMKQKHLFIRVLLSNLGYLI